MKIAIIVRNLTGGGAERVAAMWAEGFVQNYNEVLIILNDRLSPITYDIPAEAKLEYMASYAKFGIVRKIDRIMQLRKILKRNKPDVIIGLMNLNSLNAYFASLGLNIPIVHTEHNSFERPSDAPMKMFDKIGKFILNKYLYQHVTVLTQADRDVIGNRYKNVTVLPNPLAFTPAPEMPKKENVMLAMGRLDAGHYKGFDVLIKAFGMASVEGWSLQIAGSGKPETIAKYRQLAKDCGVEDKVKFLGFVDNPFSLYQKSSIFVLSSRYEGFGLVLLEAMSQGCACIACDYKGRQKEIITSEKLGLICEPDNVGELSQAMSSLLQDDGKRREIGKNAIIRSHDYTIDKIMDKWDDIFKKIKLR